MIHEKNDVFVTFPYKDCFETIWLKFMYGTFQDVIYQEKTDRLISTCPRLSVSHYRKSA